MTNNLKEELEALVAIYCKPNEFQSWSDSQGLCVKVQFEFHLPQVHRTPMGGIQFVISSDYPVSCPEIFVFCDALPELEQLSVKRRVKEMSNDLKGDYMLLNLVNHAQELLEDMLLSINIDQPDTAIDSKSSSLHGDKKYLSEDIVNDATAEPTTIRIFDQHQKLPTPHNKILSVEMKDNKASVNTEKITAVLQLDHMRSKQNYIKIIRKWTSELGLTGRLLFYRKFIFIILQGHNQGVKDYIIRNKTMIVDVDSKGRPCKERMLSILYEGSSKNNKMCQDFQVLDELSSLEDFASLWESLSMSDIFKLYIEPLCQVKSKSSSKRQA